MGGVNSRQPICDDRSVSTIGSRSLESSNNSTSDHKVKVLPKTTTFTNLDYCNLPPPPPAILLKNQRSRSSGPNNGVFAWKKSSQTSVPQQQQQQPPQASSSLVGIGKKSGVPAVSGRSVWSKLAHRLSGKHGFGGLNFRQMEDLENNNNNSSSNNNNNIAGMQCVKYASYYAPEQHGSKQSNGPSIFPVAGGSGVFPICRNPVSTIAYTANHPFKDVTNVDSGSANEDEFVISKESKNRTFANGVVGHRSNLIGDIPNHHQHQQQQQQQQHHHHHHLHHHHHNHSHHSDRRKCSPEEKRTGSSLLFRARPSSASVAANFSIKGAPSNQAGRPHSSVLGSDCKGPAAQASCSHGHSGLVPNCKTVVQMQATSSELLSCLGEFLVRRCARLRHLQTTECVAWIRSVDRALLASGWQDAPFINPANVVFVYMLVRNAVDSTLVTVDELRSAVMACLYLAYSYMGNEISYPLKPFLTVARIDPDRRGRFWYRCVRVADDSSWRMLRLNSDPAYFARLFRELKSFSPYYVNGATSGSVAGAIATAGAVNGAAATARSNSTPSPPRPLSLTSDSESDRQTPATGCCSTVGGAGSANAGGVPSDYGRVTNVPGGGTALTAVIAVQ